MAANKQDEDLMQNVMQLKSGATNTSIQVVFYDAFTGLPMTDVARTRIDMWTTTLDSANEIIIGAKVDCKNLASGDAVHLEGGLYHVGQGIYRLDLEDAVTAAGVLTATVVLKETVDDTMLPKVLYFQLLDHDPVTAINEIMGLGFDSANDSLEDIRNAITAAAPADFAPTAGTEANNGSENDTFSAGTLSVSDGTKWEITDPNDANPITVTCQFELGANRAAVNVHVEGYFNRSGGGTTVIEVEAYNYVTAAYETISGGTISTELRDRATDTTYNFGLTYDHTDHSSGNHGEIKIRFVATASNPNGVLYLDTIVVSGVSDGSISANEVATATVTALKVSTGYTAGGTMTFANAVKVLVAWAGGKWQDKPATPGTYQVLDADDAATVILETTPAESTPYKTVSIP